MARERVLIVEDEENVAAGIAENLEALGLEAIVVRDGEGALARLAAEEFDLVILDVMLPVRDGFSVCREVRRRGLDVPILFLTAKGTEEDRVRGLALGADDYLPKPFHLKELLLRVQAILRRRRPPPAGGRDRLHFGGNTIDLLTGAATAWDGTPHTLSERELRLLRTLAEREGEVVPPEELLEAVFAGEVFPATRALAPLLERLQRRFERDPEAPIHLVRLPGLGYRFRRRQEAPR